MKAPINQIIPHSLVDGPGNRTSIFFQGCNLRCDYCHNPETQEILKSPKSGVKFLTPDQVIKEVEKNIPFISGITVSGGECMLYPDFLKELFILAKERGLTRLIDTNGTIDMSKHEDLLDLTTGVMLDFKSWDDNRHRKLTGSSNDLVKKNLKYLHSRGKLLELRLVCIPNEVDDKQVLEGVRDLLDGDLSGFGLKLIKFRNNGVIGRLKDKESPSSDYMRELESLALELGFTISKNQNYI